jgi:PKD repeat protein
MNKQSTQVRVLSELISVDFSVKPASQSRILQSQNELLFLDESHDPDGTIVAWDWAFGDDQTGEGRNVTHTYIHGESYLVTLCVTNALGETACQIQTVSVVSRKPVASFTSSPVLPNKGEDVSFDAAGSFDLDGTVVQYDWDFDGDGTVDLSIDQPVTVYQFDAEGEHVVTLRVRDDSNMVSLPFSRTITLNWEPVAAFQVSNFYPAELEEVVFTDCSHDRDGGIAVWHWDFGDGNSSDLPSPAHSYPNDGTYTIVLTVTDGNGAHGTVHAVVTAQNLPPVAHIEIVVKGGKVHTYAPVTFDGSASTDQSPNGQIVLYEWDLGADGTYEESSTSPTFAYSYTDNGTYKLRLRVTDDGGATALSNPLTIEIVNHIPNCSFSWAPTSPTDAEDVTFTAVGNDIDGQVVGWHWNFGDGTTSSDYSPSHRFPDDGAYTVTLVVRDDDGEESKPYTRQIIVMNSPPIAAFSVSSTSTQLGEAVRFTDLSQDTSPTGQIVHVAWDFGDGTFCPGDGCGEGEIHAPIHIYTAPGTYTVRLSVIDDDGARDLVARTVTITE